jgi:hypothetical protein
MPIPKPTSNETKSEFIQICMTDDTMVSEFENTDQRLAVCSTSYEENLSKNTNE